MQEVQANGVDIFVQLGAFDRRFTQGFEKVVDDFKDITSRFIRARSDGKQVKISIFIRTCFRTYLMFPAVAYLWQTRTLTCLKPLCTDKCTCAGITFELICKAEV